MKHTKEPWEYGKANNYDGFYIAPRGTLPTMVSVERCGGNVKVECFNFPGETEDVARRIVSCVNALAGYNPEKVEELVKAAEELKYAMEGKSQVFKYDAAEKVVQALAHLRGE